MSRAELAGTPLGPPEVREPELVAAARGLAWWSHCNLGSAEQYEARAQAFERLRRALEDPPGRAPGRLAPTEFAFLLRAARRLAACSIANRRGAPYYERREAFAQLRGCLAVYDAARAAAERTA